MVSSSFDGGDGGVSNSTVAFFPSCLGGSGDTDADTEGGAGDTDTGGGHGGDTDAGGGGGASGTAGGGLFAPVLGDLDSTDGADLGLVAGFGLSDASFGFSGGSFAFSSFTLVDDLLFLGGFGSSAALELLAGLVGEGSGLIGEEAGLVGDDTGLVGDGAGFVGDMASLVGE